MMKQICIAIVIFFAFQSFVFGQQISGTFTQLPEQLIKLQGFHNFDTYTIDSTYTDGLGKFTLTFSAKDRGMGLIQAPQGKPLIVVLADENSTLQGKTPSHSETIKFSEGKQNQAFVDYATQQPKREQVLSAWGFLEKFYKKDDVFATHLDIQKAINKEIERLHKEEAAFLASLPKDSYVGWFLPIRKLISNVSVIAQYRQEEIPITREALRNIDFTDNRLYKSGLLREAIENHIWFIENSSGNLDSVFKELNISIDTIINQLKNDNDKFNIVTAKMFDVLEKRSLFSSSEYLANRLLNDDDCGCLNPDFEKKLHKYGTMAIGETAPDINFSQYTYFPEGLTAKKLSEINANYYLVVFAASWCPHCTTAIPQIAQIYPDLKSKNIEVILVSLDETTTDFANFAAPLPFISTTDLKKWDSQVAQDYHVYATPSYFMLDKNLSILMKLKSVEHIKSWVDIKIK